MAGDDGIPDALLLRCRTCNELFRLKPNFKVYSYMGLPPEVDFLDETGICSDDCRQITESSARLKPGGWDEDKADEGFGPDER